MPTRQAVLLFLAVLLTGCASQPDFLPARPMPSASLDLSQPLNRIAFGSCFRTDRSGDVFDRIAAQDPNLFIFLGDNVYAESEADDPALTSLRSAYGQLADDQQFAALRAKVPVYPIWDDHDMGLDDAGRDWPHKVFSEQLYEYVWDFGRGSDVARRPGVYFERTAGPPGQRTQMIFLDVRFFRSALARHPDPGVGMYSRSADPAQDLLGDAQWTWLAEQLRKPADLRIIISPIQLIADGHYWESWDKMPLEREHFYQVLRDAGAEGVIIVSGDRHSAALYSRPDVLAYPLFEMTTSSLNHPLSGFIDNPRQEPGPHRLGRMYFDSNHGLIDIDWSGRKVIMRIVNEENRPVMQRVISMDDLRAR